MSVISLTAEREKRTKPTQPKRDFGPQFYCLKCESGSFTLYASGAVRCAGCGAMMNNLTVFKGGLGTA